jgi:hypothetical protein
MPPLPFRREIRELVDPDERRPRDVPVEVCLVSRVDAAQRVPAVDEAVLDQ